jgi:uncharacterized protein (DUF1330 family)
VKRFTVLKLTGQLSISRREGEMQMNTLRKAFLALVLATPLLLALAARARADVYVLDSVTCKSGVSLYKAHVYNGVLQLVARRHGGVRVSTFHETTVPGEVGDRVVVLWRFPSADAVRALRADPNYAIVAKLRQTDFDETGSVALQLVTDRREAR